MTKEDKESLKIKMVEKIKIIEEEIIEMEELTKPIGPENAIGRISRMDAINNKSVVEAALRNKKKKHGKLKVALNRIYQDDFGYCNRCKKPIIEARLLYMPESTHCIHCAD